MEDDAHKLPDPRYLSLAAEELRSRAAAAFDILRECTLCPMECRVDRLSGERGTCGIGPDVTVSSYGPHFGEERPLVGIFGSGTIFLTGCNLRCIFCQNYDISQLHRHDGQGWPAGEGFQIPPQQQEFDGQGSHDGQGFAIPAPDRLARMMLALQERGCHNINFVTPTHQLPQILDGLVRAVQLGLRLPIVYNCGGYEPVEVLRLLDGIVDIYMPDMKYGTSAWGLEFSGVPDYSERNREAIREMHRQVGDLQIVDLAESGRRYQVAVRGLLIRHLVLPNGAAATREVARFLADEISRDTYINIIDQYRPCYRAIGHKIIGRPITSREFEEALQMARQAGLWRFAY